MCRFLTTYQDIISIWPEAKHTGNIGDIWNRFNRQARAPSDIVERPHLVLDRYVEGIHYQVLVKNGPFSAPESYPGVPIGF